MSAPTAAERQGAYPPAVSRATRRRVLGAMRRSLGRPVVPGRLRVHQVGAGGGYRQQVPTSTVYRPERSGDVDEVRGVVRAAFAPREGVERIVDDLRGSDAWLGLSYV